MAMMRHCTTIVVLAALAGALVVAVPAPAQDAQPQPPSNPPAEPAPDPDFKPGFLEALGRWFGDSRSVIDGQLKSTEDALKNTQDALGGLGTRATDSAKDAASAAREAAGAIAGLPFTRVVTGRERCTLAPNGGSDCAPAANALCRGKGFGAGLGLDITSAQKCPAWIWLSGRSPAEGECAVETFVTRAVCQ